MSLVLRSTFSAVAAGITASFAAQGGTTPYVYEVLPGGAGGTIDASSGVYTAPAVLDPDPKKAIDTIQATDADNVTGTLDILVTDVLGLFCDIIQKEMGLSPGRVYFWDQKIMQPTDSDLYVAVSILQDKPFGNTNRPASTTEGLDSEQSINVLSTLALDIISRGPAARNRKEEVLMALNSNYSQQQQLANSFYIAPLSKNFVNLSEIDGAAIPYRFNISVNVQYFKRKVQPVDYFDDFANVEVQTEP